MVAGAAVFAALACWGPPQPGPADRVLVEKSARRLTLFSQGRVIASGSVEDMRSLVGRRQISCESALTPEEVRSWQDVIEATHQRGRLHIVASDAERVVRQLLSRDPALRRLEVREAGLAERDHIDLHLVERVAEPVTALAQETAELAVAEVQAGLERADFQGAEHGASLASPDRDS